MASLTCMQNYLNTIFLQVTLMTHAVAIDGIWDTHCKTQKSHNKVKIMLIICKNWVHHLRMYTNLISLIISNNQSITKPILWRKVQCPTQAVWYLQNDNEKEIYIKVIYRYVVNTSLYDQNSFYHKKSKANHDLISLYSRRIAMFIIYKARFILKNWIITTEICYL